METKGRRILRGAVILLAGLVAVGAQDAGPNLKVEARFPEEPTGTMHYAESLTLSIGQARPLHLESNNDLLPIPGPQFRLSSSCFLLLGWSSTGGGMQSIHVMSVAVMEQSVVLVQEMALTTDRMNSGLLVRPDPAGGVRIGVPEPPSDFVHDEEGWLLSFGDPNVEPLDPEGMRGLPFEVVTQEAADVFYSPPFKLCPFPKRAAWVGVNESGRIIPNSPRRVLDREDNIHSGISGLNAYIQRSAPRLLLHGHQHREQETMVGKTRVICCYGWKVIEYK